MDEKRIEEIIRTRWLEGKPCQTIEYQFARNDILDLLDALGEARSSQRGLRLMLENALDENERLQEALRMVANHILVSHGSVVDDDGTFYRLKQCLACRSVFTNDRGEHRDDCPFKILEDDDGQ